MAPQTDRNGAPPAKTPLLVAAGICVAIPVAALMWVGSYAREDPRLGPVPFFFWYQMMWVILTAGFTYTAYRLVLRARPHRPMTGDGDAPDRPGRHGTSTEGSDQ
ncbi:MAG: DUF3311 domain-containing protein [Intrasporangium sp.]|uniref:DUF3311 domain-containing protein n=1 Tax=Intrasporangium sp. TaxID=1925024 RepID=UPI002648E744|nr:DUF3311 domain-containing protein [Intrasporangium sp.]MDN5795964.1 DUF3311 domain-containing protein [Intrasporangium sp.]